MEHTELPANIKQIGSIGEGMRIYVEDYVCSYLHTYAESGGYQERIAILIGRYLVMDGQPILFVNGAVQGKYTEVRNGLTIFTERSMEHAQSCVEQYFPGQKIVGWMQSQPSYGVYLNSGYIDVHITHFKKKYQVMFVMDPIEKTNAFYTYTKSGMTLEESKGYFIYYDKNENMHEYMVRNKMDISDATVAVTDASDRSGRLAAPAMMRTRRPSADGARQGPQEQKRMLNLLVGLSAVLFIVSFIMGAGLIQNQDRIASLERQTASLSASYQNIAQAISRDNTQPAFAEENETISAPADSAAPSETPGAIIKEDGSVSAPAPIPSPTPAPKPAYYTVKDGDTLNSISVKFFGTTDMVDRIMEYNNMTNPNLIVSGVTIKIPD